MKVYFRISSVPAVKGNIYIFYYFRILDFGYFGKESFVFFHRDKRSSLGFRSESLEEDGDILNFAIGPKVALKTSKPEQDKWNKNTMQEKLMYTLIMKNKQQIKKETSHVFWKFLSRCLIVLLNF